MITSLDIENFKCFTALHLGFGNLTLLTGFNGGGKSSALQPLLLLAQGLRTSPTAEEFPINGSHVHLGTVGDILPADNETSEVTFTVKTSGSQTRWTLGARAGDRFLRVVRIVAQQFPADGDLRETLGSPSRPELPIAEQISALAFVSAIREGVADAYPVPDTDRERQGDVGPDGRYASYWYDKFVDEVVPEGRRHPKESAATLRKQLDAWFGTLFPGAQANVHALPQVSLLNLQFRSTDIGAWRRPANVGYGFSYAFPILVALLTAGDGQLVVIDSPEAHLHPSAQSRMGRLLAHFAAAGIQIVVETHSDHLLNGVRLAVRERVLAHTLVQLHFFTGASNDRHGVVSPRVDLNGTIDEWPAGFFDQSENDLSQLAGWE